MLRKSALIESDWCADRCSFNCSTAVSPVKAPQPLKPQFWAHTWMFSWTYIHKYIQKWCQMQQVLFDLRLPDTHSNAKIPHIRQCTWLSLTFDATYATCNGEGQTKTSQALVSHSFLMELKVTRWNCMLQILFNSGMCCPSELRSQFFVTQRRTSRIPPTTTSLFGSSFIILIKSSNLLKLSGLHFQFPPTMGRRAIVGRDKWLLEQLFPTDVNDWEGLNGVWTDIKHKDLKNEVMFQSWAPSVTLWFDREGSFNSLQAHSIVPLYSVASADHQHTIPKLTKVTLSHCYAALDLPSRRNIAWAEAHH